jgi:hypothetical protein
LYVLGALLLPSGTLNVGLALLAGLCTKGRPSDPSSSNDSPV